ncbi:MAG: class I SAM-dependent methyltransferase [Candidatus Methanofastidiosia archaeon]
MISSMKETEKIKKRYNRFSRFYDEFEVLMEFFAFKKWRKNLLENLEGRILEIGVGTGKNLEYYPKNLKVYAIDFSEKMLKKANKKALQNTDLILMDAQKLGFKDRAFDYIVLTFVLCFVANPNLALEEMGRVLKRGGKILMLEHVKSKNKIISFFEEIINPITLFLFGFNVNRDTISNIRKSGFKILEEKNLALHDVFKRIVAMK